MEFTHFQTLLKQAQKKPQFEQLLKTNKEKLSVLVKMYEIYISFEGIMYTMQINGLLVYFFNQNNVTLHIS
jgi:hypothetical protein